MAEEGNTTARIEHWLGLLRQGDSKARERLITHAVDRLRERAHHMLRGYQRVQRWEATDDVLQNALLRLYHSLADVKPESARHFFALATIQIRRELIDLGRHYGGPQGMGQHHRTDPPAKDGGVHGPKIGGKEAEETGEPQSLEEWSEFHEAVARLPEKEQEVFCLRFYQGLSELEAAGVVGVTDRTVRQRYLQAKLLLAKVLRQADNER
jgi:RNA polymerase sigma-70 factor (ECF subfamily)